MSYDKNSLNRNNPELVGNDLYDDGNYNENSSLDPEHFRSLRFHCDTITSINFSPNQ